MNTCRLVRKKLAEFKIERPVDINGPYPYNYDSRPGELTLVQIHYPAGTGVEVEKVILNCQDDGGKYARPVDCVRSYRQAAFLNSNPQTGPTAGAGFIGVFILALRAGGLTNILADITMTDGTQKEVPLAMYVTDSNADGGADWDKTYAMAK
jgi:hypothetical protein